MQRRPGPPRPAFVFFWSSRTVSSTGVYARPLSGSAAYREVGVTRLLATRLRWGPDRGSGLVFSSKESSGLQTSRAGDHSFISCAMNSASGVIFPSTLAASRAFM